jgi:UDP-glucose 4-epimerase
LPDNIQEPKRKVARQGDITKSCLVVEKAENKLGWRPETSLAEGVKATLEWYQSRTK